MSTRYEVNDFNEVVPYISGRRSNDTATYRALTGYEEQLLAEIKELESRSSFNGEHMQLCETCCYGNTCESAGKQCSDYKEL